MWSVAEKIKVQLDAVVEEQYLFEHQVCADAPRRFDEADKMLQRIDGQLLELEDQIAHNLQQGIVPQGALQEHTVPTSTTGATGGLAGAPAAGGATGGLFGGGAAAAPAGGGTLFGAAPASAAPAAGGGLFGAPATPAAGGGGLFGGGAPAASSGGLFGAAPAGGSNNNNKKNKGRKK